MIECSTKRTNLLEASNKITKQFKIGFKTAMTKIRPSMSSFGGDMIERKSGLAEFDLLIICG